MEELFKIIVAVVIAVMVIGIAIVMYDQIIKGHKSYQLASDMEGYAADAELDAQRQAVIDEALESVYYGEECTEGGGLNKCYQELANQLKREGITASEHLLSRAERIKVCHGIVDSLIEHCMEEYEEGACLYARDYFMAEGCFDL